MSIHIEFMKADAHRKALYHAAENLWQTLNAVHIMLANGKFEFATIPVSDADAAIINDIRKVLAENNPSLIYPLEEPERIQPADHCQHSDDVQDEPPYESPEPELSIG